MPEPHDSLLTTSPEAASSSLPAGAPIVANPYSGNGPNRRYVDELADRLADAGLEPQVVWRPEDRAALLGDPDLHKRVRCVICAGGDGSLGDLVNDLHRSGRLEQTPIATLPIGNENLFARQFGYERDAEQITEAVLAMRTQRIDLGLAGGRLFTLMASAGFDADVVHRMAKWRAGAAGLRRVTSMDYAPKIFRTLASYDYAPLRVETDTGESVEGAHLFVFNIPQYGGGLHIGRDAQPDDAMLDWIVFQKPGFLQLADYAWTVLRAKHLGRPDVPHGRASSLRVTSDTPIPMQADGDPAGWTPIDVQVRPCAIRIVIPKRPNDQ